MVMNCKNLYLIFRYCFSNLTPPRLFEPPLIKFSRFPSPYYLESLFIRHCRISNHCHLLHIPKNQNWDIFRQFDASNSTFNFRSASSGLSYLKASRLRRHTFKEWKIQFFYAKFCILGQTLVGERVKSLRFYKPRQINIPNQCILKVLLW